MTDKASDNIIELSDTEAGAEAPEFIDESMMGTGDIETSNTLNIAASSTTTQDSDSQMTTGQILKKYRMTLAAIIFSVLTFAVAINLVPILFVPIEGYFLMTYGREFNPIFFSVIIFSSFGTQVIALAALSKLPDKVGMRAVFLFCASISAIGFLLMFFAPIMFGELLIVGMVIAAVIYGVGAGFAVVIINPLLNSLPFKNKERVLAVFHAIFALIILIAIIGTTVPIYFLPDNMWNFIPLFWIAVPVVAIILWIFAPMSARKKVNHDHSKSGLERLAKHDVPKTNTKIVASGDALINSNKKTGLLKGRFGFLLLLLVAMAAAMASESIIAKGSSMYIEISLYPIPKLIGDLLGPGLFAIGLGLGRLLYAFFGKGLDIRKFMIFGSLACFLLYLLAVFTPNPWLGVVALALVGFTVSLLLPGLLAQTGKAFNDLGTKVFLWLSTASKIGAAGGPALFGLLAGLLGDSLYHLSYSTGLEPRALGLRTALLICAIFPLISFVVQLMLKKHTGKNI